MTHAWKRTASGRYIDLLDPKVEDIVLTDGVLSLIGVPRFDNHYKAEAPLDVIQHSILTYEIAVRDEAGPTTLYAALMHDFHEYLFGDIGSPVKTLIGPAVGEAEEKLQRVVLQAFGLDYDKVRWNNVKNYDIAALHIERRCMWEPAHDDYTYWPRLSESIQPFWRGEEEELFEEAKGCGASQFVSLYHKARKAHEAASNR